MARDAGPGQRALGHKGMCAVEGSPQRRQGRAGPYATRRDWAEPGPGSAKVERALTNMRLKLI